MSAYSPGEWQVEPLQATHGADLAIVTDRGWVVAVIQYDPDIQTESEIEPNFNNVVRHPDDEPNARLISAAPNLVNALELAEATIKRLERHAPGSANGTLDVIRAALTKAKDS